MIGISITTIFHAGLLNKTKYNQNPLESRTYKIISLDQHIPG